MSCWLLLNETKPPTMQVNKKKTRDFLYSWHYFKRFTSRFWKMETEKEMWNGKRDAVESSYNYRIPLLSPFRFFSPSSYLQYGCGLIAARLEFLSVPTLPCGQRIKKSNPNIYIYIYTLIIILLSQSDLKHVAIKRRDFCAVPRARRGKEGEGSAMAAFMSSLEIWIYNMHK